MISAERPDVQPATRQGKAMRTTSSGGRTARRHQVPAGMAGLTALALLGLTACGGSAPGSAAAGGSVKAVATAAASAGTSSASSSTTSSPTSSRASTSPAKGTPSLARLALRVAAAVKAKGTARLVTSAGSSAAAVRATGVVRFRGSRVDVAMTSALPGGRTLKMVVVGGVAYMNLGEKYRGKNWVRIAPGGSNAASKALGPLFRQLTTGVDPQTQLAGAEDSKITAATHTTLRGVPATKYTVVSSEKALMAQLERFATTPGLREALSRQFKGAHAEGVMWIGDDGLPLRIDIRVLGGAAAATTTTVTYSDWGRPVSISAPPPGDTVTLAG
jgi:hypothetical protein